MRTIGDVVYDTFQEAAIAMGLLTSDKEWSEALQYLSANGGDGKDVRSLLVTIMINVEPPNLRDIWDENVGILTEDFQRLENRDNPDDPEPPEPSQDSINRALYDIDYKLSKNGLTLDKYPTMPKPTVPEPGLERERRVYKDYQYEEGSPEAQAATATATAMYGIMNDEQKNVHDELMAAVQLATDHYQQQLNDPDRIDPPIPYVLPPDPVSGNPMNMFFIKAPGGTGKSFVMRCLQEGVMGQSKVVIPVASTGLASIQMKNGTTAHRRFRVPIDLDAKSECQLTIQSPEAALIRDAAVIMFDEITMCHVYVLLAINKLLQELCNSTLPFGGKVR